MAIGTEILRCVAKPIFSDAADFWAEQYAEYYKTTADYWATHTLTQGGLEAIGEIDKLVRQTVLKDSRDPVFAAKAGIGMAFVKFFGGTSLGIAEKQLKIINEIPNGPAAVVYRTGAVGCEIAVGVYDSGLFVFSQIAGLADGEMGKWPDGKDAYQASKEFTETGIMAFAIILGALSLVSGAGELASSTTSSGGCAVAAVSPGGAGVAAVAGSGTAALAGGEAIAAGSSLLMAVNVSPPAEIGHAGKSRRRGGRRKLQFSQGLITWIKDALRVNKGNVSEIAGDLQIPPSQVRIAISRNQELQRILNEERAAVRSSRAEAAAQKAAAKAMKPKRGRGRPKFELSPEQITAIEKALRANKGDVAAAARDVKMSQYYVKRAISEHTELKIARDEAIAAVQKAKMEAAAKRTEDKAAAKRAKEEAAGKREEEKAARQMAKTEMLSPPIEVPPSLAKAVESSITISGKTLTPMEIIKALQKHNGVVSRAKLELGLPWNSQRLEAWFVKIRYRQPEMWKLVSQYLKPTNSLVVRSRRRWIGSK